MKISEKNGFFDNWQALMHQTENVLASCHRENAEKDFTNQVDSLVNMLKKFKADMTGMQKQISPFSFGIAVCDEIGYQILSTEDNGNVVVEDDDGNRMELVAGTFTIL